MTDESVCSVCSRLIGFGDEERFEPPVNLARCPAPGGMECRADAMEPGATPVVMRNMLRERLFLVARWNDAATQLLEDLDKAVW